MYVLGVRVSGLCPRLTPLLSCFLFHWAIPHTDRQSRAQIRHPQRGPANVVSGVQVSVFVWHLHRLTHTRQLLHTLMPGLGLMDGCVLHTPLDLGWDDCSVGLLTGCQGGYTEHTDFAFLCMWELLCVLRSPNNSCAPRRRENKHKVK